MNTYFSRSLRFFVGFASIGLSVTFVKAYAYYFNAFFLALVIVMSVSPIMFWLRKHGVPNWLALGVGMIVTLSMTALLAIVIALSVVRVSDILPQLVAQIDGLTESLDQFFSRSGIQVDELVDLVEPDQLFFFGRRLLDTILQSVSLFFLTVLIIFFMLVEAMAFPGKVERQLARGNPQFLTAYRFADNIRQYVGITTLLGVIGGLVIGLVLFLMDVDFAAMWGILYFILNYVPMVGFWLAMIPPALLALLQFGPGAMVIVILVYLVISTIINQILRPAFMRGGLDLSPLWSVLSLVIWAAILGPPGLIVGVPLTIAIKELVIATDENNQWVNDVISAGTSTHELAPAFASAEQAAATAKTEDSGQDDGAQDGGTEENV
jgi:predicted PurR-regulated permease PerM